MCPVPVLGISRPAAVRWANTWRKMICRHGPARAGGKERSTHDEKRILWQHMQKRLSPKKRKTQNNIKLWGERKEGRKGISRSAYLWSRFATDAHAFLLKDKSKELDVVRMELHKARVITSQAKSPSIQTTFWGGFRRACWAGPSARPSCCAGHKRSLSCMCPHPLLLYHRLLLLQVPKWLWLGFTRCKRWVTGRQNCPFLRPVLSRLSPVWRGQTELSNL